MRVSLPILNLAVPAIRYVREVSGELRKVAWLTRKQLVAYTIIVIAGSLAVSAFLGALDFILQQIVAALLSF